MKTLGIIAEYNPLHNGHKYHIDEAKRVSGADLVIAIISGSFNQRGQMCVRNKWDGARWALENGVDLVLELPAVYATSNAGTFAKGGVKILEALGVNCISFGAESDGDILIQLSKLLKEHQDEIENKIKLLSKEGLSYPKARELAISQFSDISDLTEHLNKPNNILALEYLKNLEKAQPIIVKRKGTGYNDKAIDEFPSSTAIRDLCQKGEDFSAFVPESVKEILTPDNEKLWEKAVLKAGQLDTSHIDAINSADEGMGGLLKKNFRSTNGYDDLVEKMTSKRYTATRIQRFICQLVLDIKKEEVDREPIYGRILGFNKKGSEFIKKYKHKDEGITLITNINKEKNLDEEVAASLEIDIRANDLFNLMAGKDLYDDSDYVKQPVII